jgi:hypothetical protein
MIFLRKLKIIKRTKFGANFLLYDSGKNIANRLVIFGTRSDLIHLKNNKTWYLDGTISIITSKYKQLYTIQIKMRNVFIPILFCLMTKKDFVSYNYLFSLLKTKFNLNDPERIILDFEYAPFAAFKQIFPETLLTHASSIFAK